MTVDRSASKRPRIVIVGGGAGGLELATRLGKSLGGQKADVALIDYSRTHIWKPLLHEVAAGTLDSYEDQVAYLAQASSNRFQFVLGRMIGRRLSNTAISPSKPPGASVSGRFRTWPAQWPSPP